MNDFSTAITTALTLIAYNDSGLREIVILSLEVSLTASICALVIGAPLGAALAVYRFRGRGTLIVIANALLGLPPVVVGLAVYLLLSRSGPLGSFGILFTPTAMILAQCGLGTPIVIALVHRSTVGHWRAYGDAMLVDGASRRRTIGPLMAIGRDGLLTAWLAAFGRAIAEVGAIIIVGGNIRGYTRTMTTAIALETSKGDLSFALALGMILIVLSMAVSAIAVTANTTMVMPRHLRRGKPSSRTHARLVPPPAASQPGPLPPLLLKGCAGVVLTVSETFSVPVTELGFTKQADSGRLDGVAQARAIKAV